MRLLRRAAALLQVARGAGGCDIFPRRSPAKPPRHDMVEGQILARPAILARETVAQEQVEARERRMLRRLHILAERNDARDRHRPHRRMNLALVIFDDGDAVEEYGLHRSLPGPEAQGVIAQRRIVCVEDEGRTAIGMPGKIGMEHGLVTLPPLIAGWRATAVPA